MKLFLSEEADQFLVELFEYLAIDKGVPDSAAKVIKEIKNGLNILKHSPKIGTKLKGENIRFIVVGSHVAVYEIDGDVITITNFYGKGQNWR